MNEQASMANVDLDGIIAQLVNPTDAWSTDWCASTYPARAPTDFSALTDAIRALCQVITKWEAVMSRLWRPPSPLMARYRHKRRIR